eukprot:360433-Chlamydomonas_euryale.AAC.1
MPPHAVPPDACNVDWLGSCNVDWLGGWVLHYVGEGRVGTEKTIIAGGWLILGRTASRDGDPRPAHGCAGLWLRLPTCWQGSSWLVWGQTGERPPRLLSGAGFGV